MYPSKVNILIIGGGGREHALAWKICKSPLCNDLFIAPGNAGTDQIAKNVNLNISDFEAFRKFLLTNEINLIIVGPEAPLVDGLYDRCKSDELIKHIVFVGPSKKGAQLEGSKAFAKEFMADNNIPTAAYKEISQANYNDGIRFLEEMTAPFVLKADGLAAGKGVLIIDNLEDAKKALKEMLDGQFGIASQKVVIEAFLDGIEFSVFVVTDGKDYQLLPIAKDYKRIGENDIGLNTGGMGAISPVPFVDDEMIKKVEDQIIKPTITGLQKRNIIYRGFIFIGLINVNGQPKVIEYNCRLGDPETEAIIPRIDSDLLPLLLSIESGNLLDHKLKFSPLTALTIMLVSGGYPQKYEKNKVITGLEKIENSMIFHAGTSMNNDQKIATNGGRVLAITSLGKTINEAKQKSISNAEIINFDNKYYRSDIGFDLLQ